MNNILKKNLKKYFKEIKKKLNCKSYLKLGFMADVKASINMLLDTLDESERTIENICNKFGTAEDVAASFDKIEDITSLRRKSRRAIIVQVVSILILCVVIAFLLFLVLDLINNGNAHITIDDFYNY